MAQNKINHIKWIWNEWKQHLGYIWLLVFITLLSSAVAVVYPYLFKVLIDKLQDILLNPVDDPMQPVYHIITLLLIVGVVRMVTALYPGFRAYMNLLMEYVLRDRYFGSMLGKDYRFFLKFRTGDLVTRLTNDIQDFPKIGWFLCSGIFRAFDSLAKIVFCIIMMFFLSPKLTLFSLIPIPLMIIVFFVVSEVLHERFKKNQEAISEINNQLEMTFSGIKIIKSFVCEDKYKRFFNGALKNRFATEYNLLKIGTLLHLTYEYIDYFSMITIILVGGYLTVKGDISVGTFYAFYTYFAILIYPILDLPQLFVSAKQAFVCIDRLEEISDYPVITYDTQDKVKLTDIQSITFNKVSFAYDEEIAKKDVNNEPTRNLQILQDISFHVSKGEKTLIIGSSGAGKSTLLGLICGRLIPQQGDILINGINIKNIDLVTLRNLIGYVPQEPSLFTGTIRENVLFGKDEYTQQTYDTILDVVQMSEEINQFLKRDLTLLGQKGLSLSGGQKQRIAIARALYKNPQLLMLDDITASLDAKNEDLLWQMIAPLFENLTAFIVSHRLSSLRYADNVIYIDKGNIKASGRHEELVSDNPEYLGFISHNYRK